MSHRYGYRCLPERILAKEYDILKSELESLKENIDLTFEYNLKDKPYKLENIFEACYELDDNEMPARYRLKHLEKMFKDYNFKVNNNFNKRREFRLTFC